MATRLSRPCCLFSRPILSICNIDKLGVGMGTRQFSCACALTLPLKEMSSLSNTPLTRFGLNLMKLGRAEITSCCVYRYMKTTITFWITRFHTCTYVMKHFTYIHVLCTCIPTFCSPCKTGIRNRTSDEFLWYSSRTRLTNSGEGGAEKSDTG